MRHAYHVLTPCTRPENLPALEKMLTPINVKWHVIMNEGIIVDFNPLRCPPKPEKWNGGCWAINWYILNAEIEAGARYLVLPDDDFYEPWFFDKIDAVDGSVLIVSMKRGNHTTPDPGYGTDTLVASKENLAHGKIGAEQIVVTGDILRDHRYGRAADGDWDFISSVTAFHDPVFVPDAFVWFNFLELGRWDK